MLYTPPQIYTMCVCGIEAISNQVSLLTRSEFALNYSLPTQLFNHNNQTTGPHHFWMNYLAATVTKLTFCRSALVTDTQPIFRPAASLLWQSFRHATVTAATSKMRFHCLREVKRMMAFCRATPEDTSAKASFSYG